jgi:hypothetical protein
MVEWDWVQWYGAVYAFILCVLVPVGQLMERRDEAFKWTVLNCLIHLPILGRIFGWW